MLYHGLTNNYREGIDFISLEDWKAELIALHEAAESRPSDEDTDLDREEREATQKSAMEKFNAIYRSDLPRNLTAIPNDGGLALVPTANPIRLAGTANRGLSGDDRRRSDVCRHGPHRPQSDPHLLVRDRAAGAAAQFNYAGQVALYLGDPAMDGNPFFRLAPSQRCTMGFCWRSRMNAKFIRSN